MSSPAVVPEYFSHLDMSQRRMDLDQRPELRQGSVDFAVNRDYWVQDNPTQPGSSPREPTPLHYIFAIDVSWSSVRCGVVQEAVAGLKELFYGKKVEGAEGETAEIVPGGLPEGAKVAIITFDKSVQFYNLKVSCHENLSSYWFADFVIDILTGWSRASANVGRFRYRRHVCAAVRRFLSRSFRISVRSSLRLNSTSES